MPEIVIQPSSINPYSSDTNLYRHGLEEIVADLAATGGTITIAKFTESVAKFIKDSYLDTTTSDQDEQLYALVGNLYNAYIGVTNPLAKYYSPQQLFQIKQVFYGIKKNCINPNSSANYFMVASESIANSGLSAAQQAPILMALANATTAYPYFFDVIPLTTGPWTGFLSPVQTINYMNLSRWVEAAFRGSLIGATQSVRVVPSNVNTGLGVAVNIPSTTAGALIATFGEIVFHWVQKPYRPFSYSSQISTTTN